MSNHLLCIIIIFFFFGGGVGGVVCLPFSVISSACPWDNFTCVSLVSVTGPEACYIGTEPWKPKEALEENGIVTDKADIFAFGLTLWEMMTLSIPHITLLDDDDDGMIIFLM